MVRKLTTTAPRKGRPLAAPRPADPSVARGQDAVSAKVEGLEREHVGAGGDAHPEATAELAGFLPAVDGNEGDVLTIVRGPGGKLVAAWRTP